MPCSGMQNQEVTESAIRLDPIELRDRLDPIQRAPYRERLDPRDPPRSIFLPGCLCAPCSVLYSVLCALSSVLCALCSVLYPLRSVAGSLALWLCGSGSGSASASVSMSIVHVSGIMLRGCISVCSTVRTLAERVEVRDNLFEQTGTGNR
jgi:hypothetical protein